jgi:hypothetical protein
MQRTILGKSREGLRIASAALAFIGLSALGHPLTVQAAESPEQATPQGQDAPGADIPGEPVPGTNPHESLSEKLDRNQRVIEPPPVGDEGIHTQVPNPEAGHEEEVIRPPDTPGGSPDVELR